MNNLKQVGIVVLIPFALAVPPIVGWAIGNWLDKQLNTAPFLMYLLLLLGGIAGARECYRIISQATKNE